MLYPLTPSDALATLIDLYPPDAHPGLPFLADLLKQPACRAWYTADADQVTAAIWYLSTGTHAELSVGASRQIPNGCSDLIRIRCIPRSASRLLQQIGQKRETRMSIWWIQVDQRCERVARSQRVQHNAASNTLLQGFQHSPCRPLTGTLS